MPSSSAGHLAWTQLSMLSPEWVRIELSVVRDPLQGTHDIHLRVIDRGTNALVGLYAWPIRNAGDALTDIDDVLVRVRELLEAVIEPF